MRKSFYHSILLACFCVFVLSGESNNTATDALILQQLAQPILYCPWRQAYKELQNNEGMPQQKLCAFCAQIAANNDEKYFIIHRFAYHFLMLNAFPTQKGHMLIVPYSHVGSLCNLAQNARQELMEIIAIGVEMAKETLQVDGVNVGFNLGPRSGASIPDHLHAHIVPCFSHKTGYYRMVAKTTVISWDMHKLYVRLKQACNKLII